MDSYNHQAMDAIKRYHAKYGKYPRCIEATAKHREQVAQKFVINEVCIPVVAIGTCDIVFRGLLIRNTDINLEKAECATLEQFHRLGAKLARAGLVIMGEKSSWGLQTYNPHLYFHQIKAYVFGEEATLDEAMTEEKFNQLPGD